MATSDYQRYYREKLFKIAKESELVQIQQKELKYQDYFELLLPKDSIIFAIGREKDGKDYMYYLANPNNPKFEKRRFRFACSRLSMLTEEYVPIYIDSLKDTSAIYHLFELVSI